MICQNTDSLLNILSSKELSTEERLTTLDELLDSEEYLIKNLREASTLVEEQYILAKQFGVSEELERALSNKIRISFLSQNYAQCIKEIDAYLELKPLSSIDIATVKITKAECLHKIGESQLALQLYENLLPKKNQLTAPLIFDIQSGIGLIHYRLGEYSKAINVYETILVEFDTIKDLNCKKAVVNTNVGNVYYSLNDLEKALHHYLLSIDYQKTCGGEEKTILKIANIGKLHLKAKRYDSALKYFNQSLALSIKYDKKVYVVDNNIEIANTYIQQNLLTQANNKFKEIEPLVVDLEEYETMAFYYYSYGQLLLQTTQYSKGKMYCQKAYQLCEKSAHIAGMSMCMSCLELASEELKDYQSALFWNKEKQILADSIKDEKAIKKLAKFEAKMENLKQQEAYEREIINTKLNEEKVKTRNTYLTSLLGLLSMLLVFYYMYANKRKIEFSLLEEKNDLLEKDIANKKLIATQTQKLIALGEFKTRLFDNISHELQTPITIINLVANSLSKNSTVIKENSKDIAILKRNGKNLKDLTHQLLELSKLEKGVVTVNKSRFYLYQLINPLLAEYQLIANNENIALIVDKYDCYELILHTDFEKVKIILSNFLSNAIKFSKKNDKILFTINLDKNLNTLTFQVKDTGLGIPKEFLENVFDRFYTSAGKSEHNTKIGLGLGLSISEEYASMINSKIKLESEENKGSTFMLELPLATAVGITEQNRIAENTSYSSAISDKPPTKDTILIVEDNKTIWTKLTEMLGEKYQLVFKENGEEGVAYLQTNASIMLIITDIVMPKMDGLELIENIPSNEPLVAIPILILTAKHDIEREIAYLGLSPENYLIKPIEKELLLSKVETLIKIYKIKKVSNIDDLIDYRSTTISSKDKAFIDQIKEIVETSLNNPNFDAQEVAQKMEFSITHINRKFKELTQYTISKYIVEKRYLKAYKLIKNEEVDSVKAVCYMVGFKTPKYFSKNFKQRFTVNPSQLLRNDV